MNHRKALATPIKPNERFSAHKRRTVCFYEKKLRFLFIGNFIIMESNEIERGFYVTRIE